MVFAVCTSYVQKICEAELISNQFAQTQTVFCTNSRQNNELKFTSAISLRNSASWRWLKIVMKWRHWSICTWKGWRRTDASPVWWVYTIPISSVTRQVWRSGLQRKEAQKQIWHSRAQGYYSLIMCAKLILCSSRYLGLFQVLETIFRSRHHDDEERFILSTISQIFLEEIGRDKMTLETH